MKWSYFSFSPIHASFSQPKFMCFLLLSKQRTKTNNKNKLKKKISKTKTKTAQTKTRFVYLNKVFVQHLPRDMHCQKSGESMGMLRLTADFTSPF